MSLSSNAFIQQLESAGLSLDSRRLRFQLDNLFRTIKFEGKRMIDIGSGSGIHGLYAAYCGATEVLCLEPDAQGSRSESVSAFTTMQRTLGADNVGMLPITLQEYVPGNRTWDIVFLHNSINHLDESACERLLESEDARATYIDIGRKLYSLTAQQGSLILCDCSSRNFFGDMGIDNPIAKGIEWEKHQSPRVWTALLRECGFASRSVRWTTPSRWGSVGRLLLSNQVGAYFLSSHFCLTMLKPPLQQDEQYFDQPL